MKIRVVILPSKKSSHKATQLSVSLGKKLGNFFVVDNKKRHIHLTLCKVSVHKNKLPEFYRMLKSLEKETSPLSSNTEYIRHKDGWVLLFLDQKTKFKKLRNKLIKAMSQIKVKELKSSFGAFDPHFTLLRFRSKTKGEELTRGLRAKGKFKFDRIAVCLSDEQGQVYKILKEYKIGRY